MAHERNCFTVTWRIENYNFCFQPPGNLLSSPSFVIDSVEETLWKLSIIPQSQAQKEHIVFFVQIMNSLSINFEIDIKIPFLDGRDSSPFKKLYEQTQHKNIKCYVLHSQLYGNKEKEFKLPETLTICCEIYRIDSPFSEAGKCFMRTRIRVEKTAFIGFLENFNSIVPCEKRSLTIKSASAEKLLLLDLVLDDDIDCNGKVWIEVVFIRKNYVKFCVCKVFILNSERKTKCGMSKILLNETQSEQWKFPLVFNENCLKENAQFLKNNTLKLKFEFTFSTGVEYERVEDTEFGNLLPVTEKNSTVPCALEGLTRLYEEGILCDARLQTATETFKAHKIILSARSSVFKNMFTTDSKEKATDCVIIEDLEADTIRRMLTYLYSNKLDVLDFECAERLFFAADKYNIVCLKHKCSDFLKSSLQTNNNLSLVDEHQDENLKNFLQEFLADCLEEVLHSDQ